MANLLSLLRSSSNTLNVYDQVLAVTQNNVANASTPGYAKQELTLEAMPFDLGTGAIGGVTAGQVQSARDEFAETAVRREALSYGYAQQSVASLTNLNSLFDVTGQSGISSALNTLLQSFSAWGQSPTDNNARSAVIDAAGQLASAFQQTANGLANLRADTETQVNQTVTQVNALVGQLRDLNARQMANATSDPSADALKHSLLEQLSQYVDFTAINQKDGTVSVLMNGQTPLLLEDKQYQISASLVAPTDPTYAAGPRSMAILASDGTDITAKSTAGQLGSLLNLHNTVLPTYIGDSYQPGDLNRMAKQFADRVNTLLQSGYQIDGTTQGVALFQYDTTDDTQVASSLTVDSTVTASQLAALDPGPPTVANGIPLALSALASPTSSDDKIDGVSYSAFFGALAGRAGTALSQAQNDQDVEQSALAQAKSIRDQASGVSLDEEAMIVVQFERAYEANSKLITVLDQLTQDTINMLQP